MNPALHMPTQPPAKIGVPHDPQPRLRPVPSERELLDELTAARGHYAQAIDKRKEVHGALERAKLDADTSSFSRRAAAAYLSGADASSGIVADSAKARGAEAALPTLRERLKESLQAESHARDGLRSVLSRIAALRRDQAAAEYARTALALGDAWRTLLAADQTAITLGVRAIVPDIVATPICAIALDATPKAESSEANGTRWLVTPDGQSHYEAAKRRAYEQQKNLRELVPDGVPWPFDPNGVPMHLLERFR